VTRDAKRATPEGGKRGMKEVWSTHNAEGSRRVIVTKKLPGSRWLNILTGADCAVEVCDSDDILTAEAIAARIGDRCHGAIGQLTEDWSGELFAKLAAAGGTVFSTCAVGYNNVDVPGATAARIAVGNTPGVLTETTAEMAVALTLAAGRRVVEADRFMRSGRYEGWLPTLFVGQRLHAKTVGVIGCGRIGTAYARMMVEGFKMNLIYFDLRKNEPLESYVAGYARLLADHGEPPVKVRRAETIDEIVEAADVLSLHTGLDETTHHLIDAERLARMKSDAILVNTSRGPVIDEAALVEHCRTHPDFRVALDVFEEEPAMKRGLAELDNVTVTPHIASATVWTRQGMATLAAANVAAVLLGRPMWRGDDVQSFLEGSVPPYAPSIINAAELGLT
jgi:hydroxypyruvate reductase 1